MRSLAAAIRRLPDPGAKPVASRNQATLRARTTFADLAAQLESTPDPKTLRNYTAWAERTLNEVTAALHTELGVALLGHCYAYYGSPQTAALSYDPEFIRKHDFYPHREPSAPGWSAAELLVEKDNERGESIVGSLAGLQTTMNRLEMAASAQSFGKWEAGRLLPAMLSGMRAVNPQLRTDRAQEFVALSVRLGRELAASCLTARAGDPWCLHHLTLIFSPSRMDQATDLLSRRGPVAALELLSPSELLFLGEAYLGNIGVLPARARSRLCAYGCDPDPKERVSGISSPALDRLREIIPADGSADSDAFQREVGQYGCCISRRLGLSQVSFQFCDSYELLQSSASPAFLFDRINDLKIRLAETGYAAGAPASVAGLIGELALEYLVADPALVRVGSWSDLVKETMHVATGHYYMWMEELLNRGSLSVYSGRDE